LENDIRSEVPILQLVLLRKRLRTKIFNIYKKNRNDAEYKAENDHQYLLDKRDSMG
jgi:hypothetical protein